MKSIEEKAKAYDKALERARAINNGKDVDIEAGTTICEYIFPELKENEDGKMWKLIKKYAHSNISDMALKADHITRKQLESWLEKQSEQKSADKVKPKFKIGDWIANDYCAGKIIALTNDAYLLDSGQGIPFSCEHNVHLWTLRDAREGDVLSNDNHILILKELVYDWSSNGTPYSVKAYCGIKPDGNFEICKDNWCFCGTLHIHPATKEQCNTLKKEMADAGYIFDFDKKELKKIEDEPSLKCKGCNNVKGCIACVDGSEWARIEEQKPTEWSEGNERKLGESITISNVVKAHLKVKLGADLNAYKDSIIAELNYVMRDLKSYDELTDKEKEIWTREAFNELFDF